VGPDRGRGSLGFHIGGGSARVQVFDRPFLANQYGTGTGTGTGTTAAAATTTTSAAVVIRLL